MLRREFLLSLTALAASPAFAQEDAAVKAGLALGRPEAFNPAMVESMARLRAERAYAPRPNFPEAWTQLDYDAYRKLRFDTDQALWADEAETPVELDVFAPGLYFPQAVRIHAVEDGLSRPVTFDLGVFDNTEKFPDLPINETLGYSGLRLRSQLRSPEKYEEFAVFQGASYFRAIGTGDTYGLSARGLALDVAEPDGEEFPSFVAFWVEKPRPGEATFVVHALLDTPSCTGAYRFAITPGQPLEMQVEAVIFARTEMTHVGVAPLTSMFKFDETNRDRFSDFRPQVHDSDGLLIHNGAGETLWRPMANPRNLQISAFVDNNPRGFGLMQRARRFSDFADLEALYHNRPGLWVTPGEGWGKGAVTLVEIPTQREIYDNIVSYWRPDAPWEAGSEHRISYGLSWGARSDYGEGLAVLNTRIGKAFGDGIQVLIDFGPGPGLPEDLDDVERLIRSSAGEVTPGILQRNPETGGPRLAFKFLPGDAGLIEFRAALMRENTPISETWLYRWTP